MLLASARENSTDSARGGKSEFNDKQKATIVSIDI
jgi:hypothetical protein